MGSRCLTWLSKVQSGTFLPLKIHWPLTQRCFSEHISRIACTCGNEPPRGDYGSTAHLTGWSGHLRPTRTADTKWRGRPSEPEGSTEDSGRKQSGKALGSLDGREHPRKTQAQFSSSHGGRRQDRVGVTALSDHSAVSCDACHVIPHNP